MLRTIIRFDENKIIQENKYTLKQIEGFIDKIFCDDKIIKVNNGEFVAEDDMLIKLLAINTSLTHLDFFVSYIKDWWWFESDEEYAKMDYEDLKITYELV